MSHEQLPSLELPNRWEKLVLSADDKGINPGEFVERIDVACQRIDSLLEQVKYSNGGVFEILLGLSGSGKTTFVNTLPKFFNGLNIHSIPPDVELTQLKEFIQRKYVINDENISVFLIERRDNPEEDTIKKSRQIFSNLLDFFRTREGSCLVLWTITDRYAAEKIASEAWSVGRDSICMSDTKGIFEFSGLEKEKYQKVADDTAKNLTGDGLDAFGIDHALANSLIADCDTISEYYGKLNTRARDIRGRTWSVLKEKIHPKLWIVLPVDERELGDSTVKALTQGTISKIDIDLICEFLDDPNTDAQYVKDWKTKRSSIAHLFRSLDVRLFTLPPNVSVGAIRCFGEDIIKQKLKVKVSSKSQVSDALRKTRLYKEIEYELFDARSPFAQRGSISPDTKDEYRRAQAQAGSSDKLLNRALGELVKYTIETDFEDVEIEVEKRSLTVKGIQPDISIKLDEATTICIEPTWRSSGAGVQKELKPRQSTLSEGHIKQYILGKVWDYVKALDL